MSFLISVIMPVYNGEKFVQDAIISVTAQTYKHWELIVIDDGSTDNTAEIVKEYAANEPKVKYLYQENRKQAAARNLGIAYSRGEWIAFLDADDYWAPQKLQVQHDHVISNNGDFFFTGGYIIDENDTRLSDYETLYGRFTGMQMYRKLYEFNVIPILSVLIRSSLLKETGAWDESKFINGTCEDFDYWIRVAKLDVCFFGIDQKLFSYRINPDGVSRNQLNMDLGQMLVLIKNFDRSRFTDTEIRKVFVPGISSLFIRLLRSGKVSEASALIKAALAVPIHVFKIQYLSFKLLGKRAILPVRIMNRIDGMYRSIQLNKLNK